MSAAENRRTARGSWEVVVTRAPGRGSRDDDDDVAFWLRVPQAERASLTWELSRELYSLAARNGGVFDEETGTFDTESSDLERRLPRAAFVVTRR